MRHSLFPCLLLLGASLMAGCGQGRPMMATGAFLPAQDLQTMQGPAMQGPASMAPAAPVSAVVRPSAPNTLAPQTVQLPAQDPHFLGPSLLQRMRQALTACHALSVDVRSFSQGNYDKGVKKDTITQGTIRLQFQWQRPNMMKALVVESTTSGLAGATMSSPDGSNFTIHASGILGWFPIHMSSDDGRLANHRGNTINENTVFTQLQRLTAPSASWNAIGTGSDGSVLLRVDGVQRLDAGITSETLNLDPTTLNLHAFSAYAGSQKVIDNTVLSFQWNPSSNLTL
jgi:hypothetical protein